MGPSKHVRIHNGFDSANISTDAEDTDTQTSRRRLVDNAGDELEAFRRREVNAAREAQKTTTMKGRKLKIVIKLGSSSIVDPKTFTPILPIITQIVATAVELKNAGHSVIIVSSGAIAVGLQRMKLSKKPKDLPAVQALAAIGQCNLITIWRDMFQYYNIPVAQILLTRNDIADHHHRINAENTLNQCLKFGVIPIVNENDTLSVSEIKFGDNDTLSAITAEMVHADYLFLMTDVDALYDSNPRTNPHAQPIEVVEDIDALQVDVSSRGSSLGTGGMATKITAARLATSAGTTCIITKSDKPNNIGGIIEYLHPAELTTSHSFTPLSDGITTEGTSTPLSTASTAVPTRPPLHTRFLPSSTRLRGRKFWILHSRAPHGTIYIDRGAANALQVHRAGLRPVGIVNVEGHFNQQECVRIVVTDRQPMGSLTPAPCNDAFEDNNHPSTPGPNGYGHTRSRSYFNTLFTKGEEIGRGIVNYSSEQIKEIKGVSKEAIAQILGYSDSEYVCLRENIALHPDHRSGRETPGRETPRPQTPTAGQGHTPENSVHDLRGLQLSPAN